MNARYFNPLLSLLSLASALTLLIPFQLSPTIIQTTEAAMTMSMSKSLAGSRVLVTGGGRGIGRAIAHICAKQGAKVAICSRTKSELEETAAIAAKQEKEQQQYHAMDIFQVDLLNKTQVDDMVSSLIEKWGDIDILINNAGKGQAEKGPSYSLGSDDLQDILNLNVVSVHTVTSSVVQRWMMAKNGDDDDNNKNVDSSKNNDESGSNTCTTKKSKKIINVSSRAAKIGIPNMAFYVTSKFALEGYSATLAEELKEKDILVNTISPGMVDTKSFPKKAGRKGVRSPESIEDGLFVLLNTDKTGHYLHVDELDMVRARGLDDSLALKPINEEIFSLP